MTNAMDTLAQRNLAGELRQQLVQYFQEDTDTFLHVLFATRSVIGGSFATAIFRGENIQAAELDLEVFVERERISSIHNWLTTTAQFVCDHQLETPSCGEVASAMRVGVRLHTYETHAVMDQTGNAAIKVVTYKGRRDQYLRLLVTEGDWINAVFSMPHTGLMNFFTPGWAISLYPEMTMGRTLLKFHPGTSPEVQRWEQLGWTVTTAIPVGHLDAWRRLKGDPRTFKQSLNIWTTTNFADWLPSRPWRLTIDPPLQLPILEAA
ncbi:hypothetical protein ONZ45_g9356 [Pleurotus djamor]|nr:hypothetical protein ONZ45_g9356 [Pleurotus djamor]